MKNSYLISLLQQLNPVEFKRFGDFLESPFHNSNKNCLALYQYLKRFYPDFEAEKVDKNKIGTKIFGSQEKADKNMASLMTTMSNLVGDFLCHLQLEANPDIRSTFLLKGLSEKGLKRPFISQYQRAIQELAEQETQIDIAYFGNKYEKLTLLQEFNELNKDNTLTADLQQIADVFAKHSFLQQLHIAAIIINKASFKAIEYDSQAIEDLLATVESKNFLSETLIELYYHILKLLINNMYNREEATQDFLLLKQTLSKATATVAKEQLHNFYAFAYVYCNKQVQKGKEAFRKEALELYKQQLAQNALKINGYIVPNNVYNMVTLGLQCGEWEWVRQFIEFAKHKVAPKFVDNLYAFNLAKLHFYTKEFDKCIEALHGINGFIDALYQMEAKSLLLRVYYEQHETLAFEALVVSFREYIYTQESIPKGRKESYLNFVRFANQLYKHRSEHKKISLAVQKAIEECANISERAWLLEKADALL